LTYHDSVRSLAFYGDEVRTVDVPDLGGIISVTIAESVDVGSTTFSLVVPVVVLPDEKAASTHVETKGITTIHRAFVLTIGHPQREIYAVTALKGTAGRGPLPV
jgi:hypothetical protein